LPLEPHAGRHAEGAAEAQAHRFQQRSVWLALMFSDMEINRFKGLIAIIVRGFSNLERAPKIGT